METTPMPQDVLAVLTAAQPVERAHPGKCRTPSRRPAIYALDSLQVVRDGMSGHDDDRPGSNRDGLSTRRSLSRLEPGHRSMTVPPVRYL